MLWDKPRMVPYLARLFSLAQTMVLTTQSITDGIQTMFSGLTKDAQTDFKHGQVLASVLSYVSDFVATQPDMMLKL